MMRLVVGLLIVFCWYSAQAQVPVSFEHAVTAFEAGQHERARVAFKRMAQAGLTEAQFNYGAMLIGGQGGSRELVEGSAWIQLAADDGYQPAGDAIASLRQQLSEERWSDVEQMAAALAPDHGRQALLERHRPRLSDPDGEPEHSSRKSLETTLGDSQLNIDLQQPRYPRDAAESGIMGVVLLGIWIEPDGQVRHPHVVSAYPEGTFEREALRAWTQLEAEWVDSPPSSAQYITQQITFTLNSLEPGPYNLVGGPTLRELRRTVEASEDDLAAQHRLVWMIDKLALPDIDPLEPALVIQITHQAALAGVADAQLDLARKFRQGKLIDQCSESARFWLMQAAFEGHAEASFELSRSEQLDPAYRRDLRHAAIEQGMLAAVLWEIRHLVEHPDQASAKDMAALLERLPRQIRRDRNDPVMAEARRMASG